MNKLTLHNLEVKYKDCNEIILKIPSFEINVGLNFLIGKNGLVKLAVCGDNAAADTR